MRASAWAATLASLPLAAGAARAANPTTADCIAASDASLTAGNEHKLRAERSQLLACAALGCPSDVRKECMRRVEEVNTQIPTIIFAAKDGRGNDLGAVKVTMDGELLTSRLEGTALSIDPGPHSFTFETPGEPPVTRSLLIQEAQKERREVIVFGAPPTTPTSPAETPRALGAQRLVALVAGGVGLVGLGVGGVSGAVALSDKSDAQTLCPTSRCPTQAGLTKWQSTATAANVSTAAFIVGAVGVVGAAVLWFTAPGPRGASAQVGVGLGTVQVAGTW